MDDFPGLLARDFGFRPQGKSAPMAPSTGNNNNNTRTGGTLNIGSGGAADHVRSSSFSKSNKSGSILDDQDRDSLLFSDVFGGPPKYNTSRGGGGGASTSAFDYDSIFKGSNAKSSTLPVYDKPVYDDDNIDIFDGLPGLKSSSTSSFVKYNDVFSSISSRSIQSPHFDDLLGNLGRTETKSSRVEKGVSSFDDLLPGFGTSNSPSNNRQNSESSRAHKPTSDSTKTTSIVLEDPFDVLDSTSNPVVSSSGLFMDPLEQISKLSNSGIKKGNGSSINGGVFDDLNPLDSPGKSVPETSFEMNKRGKDRSPLKTGRNMSVTQTLDSKEPFEKSSMKISASNSHKKINVDDFQESHRTLFDMPTVSTESHNFFGRTASPLSNVNANPNDTNSQVDTYPRSEENLEPSDDVWLSVSEIPLFTQPTSARPPSRPPPPRPARVSKSETGSFASTNARKKVDEFSSFSNSTQYSHSSKSVRAGMKSPMVSQIDELEEFALGRTRNNIDERADVLYSEEAETSSVAAASAAAMKEAMDRAEAKFRHAKEAREREYLKASRNKEAVQVGKDERDVQEAQDREVRENHGRLDGERQQRERVEEREQRRLEREREREREKARQAVERATREARERAAAEARLKAERAAVEKANAATRERAERAAVQRAQAEARERAATDARDRAEKAAAEARGRANAEAREKETQERAAVARAETEAQLRAKRAAVEKAAAEARERAAASAKANYQKNENDLESFFSMGSRPSSAPRPRANSSEPAFDPQVQSRGGPEVANRTSVGTSSSMRKAPSTTNVVDDLSSIFGGAAPSSVEFPEVEGENDERQRARLERHQRTQERAAKALAEKNQRDLQTQRDQAERHRISETLDVEIKRWALGKEGNLRALLSTLQYVLWPECGWQTVSLTDLLTAASVKKAYRKATLCIHPDKVQQKGANLQQKYIAEKVFDLLKEAWNKFNSEELF